MTLMHRLLSILALSCAALPAAADLVPRPDSDLQAGLERALGEAHLQARIEQRKLAVALVVMGPGDEAELAMVNGRRMVYAASLPKLAILFGAMVQEQEGYLHLDDALLQDLHDMIRTSCNPCATRALDRIGRERLLDILQRPEFGFYDADGRGGLWVGKDYSGSPAHARDPLYGISHGTTAFQAARLLYRLQAGELLDERHTRLMLDVLGRPGISHKFVAALEDEPGVELWRKSGTWRDFHADGAIVQYDGGRYILVGLVEDAEGEALLRELARRVHALVSGDE